MQPFNQNPQIQTRSAVLILLKGVAPPMVFYVDDHDAVYNDIKQIIKNASPQAPKLVEQTSKGPLKKLCVLDTQIAGVVIQEEQYSA